MSLAVIIAVVAAACGGSSSTDQFCERWQQSVDQLAVVAGLDESDPDYDAALAELTTINSTLYETAPADVREAAQRLADLTASSSPEDAAALADETDELSNTILTFVGENCES
ncbi:MAG: hypothetical protein V3R84_01665 [Acidimicrobiia bacterium]